MLKINKKINEASSNSIAIISSIIILLGIFIFSYNYIQDKKSLAYVSLKDIFKEEEKVEETKDEVKEENPEVVNEEPKMVSTTYNYIGYLVIPKISLKRGFMDINSPYNNVDRNILVVNKSTMPDTPNSNLIIAGHSGDGWKAFFMNLYKLNIGDEASIIYKGKKYTYRITNIYNINKNGKVAIYRDYDKKALTLITCTKDVNDKQTVYIAYLEKEENI